jgi:putative membrane protein
MFRLLATTALAGALLAGPVWAQTMDQGSAPPSAPPSSSPSAMPSAAPSNSPSAAPDLAAQDRSFFHDAAIGGNAEVKFGKLAENKARAKSVKDFARQMVADHGKANSQLADLAKADGVALPPALDEKHMQEFDRLGKQSGGRFDRMYIHDAIDEHQAAVKLFTDESQSGGNADLKRFAAETLPTIQQHLQMAQSIDADLNRHAPVAHRPAPGESSGSSIGPHEHMRGDDSADALNRQELQSLKSN